MVDVGSRAHVDMGDCSILMTCIDAGDRVGTMCSVSSIRHFYKGCLLS